MQPKFIAALGLFVALSACNTYGFDSDTERAVAGAALGAGTAAALDADLGTGIAIGALAGVFCDDAGVCR
ncbi:MAG: hypothetical protein AAF919_03930 [Pseudomonadota bacterium]